MDRLLQNGLYLLLIAIIAGVIIYLSPKQVDIPHGILLPAQNSYPAISPTNIKIYNSSTMPTKYKPVGIIRASLHYTNTDQSVIARKRHKILNYTKALAAKHGANGLVYSEPQPSGAPTYTLDMQGALAIRTGK